LHIFITQANKMGIYVILLLGVVHSDVLRSYYFFCKLCSYYL